jgi:MoaA/NifB/PqqE/SkfB family radical SAM enzyme
MAWMKISVALTKLPELLIKGRFSFDFDGVPLTAKKLSLPKRLNLLKVGIDTIIRSNKMHGLPPVIQIEPTNICNLKCPLCPTGSDSSKRQKGFMTLDTLQLILGDLENVLIAVYLYSYGEPFMNKNLPQMIEACTKRNILTLTTTNGHFIDKPEDALKIVDAGLTTLIIAIDGSSQAIYEKYRKTGDLEKVKQCVTLIEEAKIRRGAHFPYTIIRSVVMRHNVDDLPNVEQLARRLGVNMFAAKTVGCLPQSAHYKDYEPIENDMRRFRDDRSPRNVRSSVRCPFPFRQPTVFWDGTVVGSEHDYGLELPFGKIGECPFSKIWNSANAIRMRRSIRQCRNLPLFCDACPHRDPVRKGVELINKELRSSN